jgi:hypothetical protein
MHKESGFFRDVRTGQENLTLVHAGEPLPAGASVFLAGPTPPVG